MKRNPALGILRITALIVVISGALGSVGFTLHTGRNNPSVLLILLFVVWVLSPFVALLVAYVISNRWPVITRVAFYSLMIVLTIGSLVSYAGLFSPSGTKPAFVFLVVPLISWLLIAIFIPIARLLSRRSNST